MLIEILQKVAFSALRGTHTQDCGTDSKSLSFASNSAGKLNKDALALGLQTAYRTYREMVFSSVRGGIE